MALAAALGWRWAMQGSASDHPDQAVIADFEDHIVVDDVEGAVQGADS